MKIKRNPGDPMHRFTVTVNWEDYQILLEGKPVGTRYDGDNKVIIQTCYQFDKEEPGAFENSLRQEGYGEYNRTTSDIDLFIPAGVLRCSFIRAYRYLKDGGNIIVTPDDPMFNDINICVELP
jgi:hypothetical protein